jgi:hypothetical protein
MIYRAIATKQFEMKISALKSTVIAFKGLVTIRSKTVIYNIGTSIFTHFGCKISYEEY